MKADRETLQGLIPHTRDASVDWHALQGTALGRYINQMKATPQSPKWHREGDVWTHTQMVVSALLSDEDYWQLNHHEQEVVFMAALLHDIGKPACTVTENGDLISPRHTITGAKIARELMWAELGICGSAEQTAFRESVCTLIRYHGMPLHIADREDPERKLIEIASRGELASDFTLSLLRLLVRADLHGRLGESVEDRMEAAELSFLLAEDLGIMERPYPFPDALTKHAYLGGRQVPRDYPVYDDTWKEVILLSALPGTGKDTFIRTHYPTHSVISLDDIRRDLRISPTDREGQGIVISRAKEIARDYLRDGIPFIWNATNITPSIRQKQLDLFEKYRAFTHIIYLETDFDTEIHRNRDREHTVPYAVIRELLAKCEPPTADEAHMVEWIAT